MLRSFEAKTEDVRTLPLLTLPEIRNMILLTNPVPDNAPLENKELLILNRIVNDGEQSIKRDQEQFLRHEEEENEDAAYRHSYREDQLLMQAIREGLTADAVRYAENMDRDAGRLSGSYLRHRRNLAMIGIALCARAAIDGGISPESAYRISGYYIEKCDITQDQAHILLYRNRAIEELAGRVAEELNRSGSSSYIERAMDYIRKHYREKIYLEDVAETLGISEGYLSRLFRKETGECFQDQVNKERVERASNMLLYSDYSLTQISEYVNFPNQSYFGKIFKKYKNMTPKSSGTDLKTRKLFKNRPR